MDVYKEQLIRKAITSQDQIRKFALFIAALAVSGILLMLGVVVFPAFALIGIFASAGVLYGAYYLVQGMQTEYEYIFTNGDLDIDKISGQRSRKRLATINVRSATAFGKYSEDLNVDSSKTVINASSRFDEQDWYIEFKHRDHGDCILIFTPNDEILSLVKDSLPRNLKVNLDK